LKKNLKSRKFVKAGTVFFYRSPYSKVIVKIEVKTDAYSSSRWINKIDDDQEYYVYNGNNCVSKEAAPARVIKSWFDNKYLGIYWI